MKAVGPAFSAARKAVEADDLVAAKAAAESLSKSFVETEAFFNRVTEVREVLRGIQPRDVEPDIEQVTEDL